MSITIAPFALRTVAQPRDALSAQAARVLRVTAQQWGMCLEQRSKPAAALRLPAVASKGISLCWQAVA